MSAVAETQAKGQFGLQKVKFIVAALIVLLVIGYLLYAGLQGSVVYYRTVSEIKAEGASLDGEEVRVSGQLVKDSIEWDAGNLILKFTITDGTEDLLVVYEGPVPDTFWKSTEIIVEGACMPSGVFEAHTILLKCPSKYEAVGAK